MRRYPLVLALGLFTALPCAAQERNHDITIDDYFSLGLISASAIAPDGKNVAYSEARWQESTGDRKADLWIVDTDKAKPRKLTKDRSSPRGLAWSGDSKTIFFLANRKLADEKKPPLNGKTQVWRIDASGENLTAMTKADDGVETFAVTADGKQVFYVVHVEHRTAEWKALREKHGGIEYGHGVDKVSQVWRLNTETSKSEKVVYDERYIYEIALTPDGTRMAMITAPDERVISFEGKSRVEVWDASTGKTTPIADDCYRKNAKSPYAWIENVAIAADGKTVAFNAIWDGYPCEIVIGHFKDGGWTSRLVPRLPQQSVRGYGSPLQFPGKYLMFLLENQGRIKAGIVIGVEGDKPVIAEAAATDDRVESQFSLDTSLKRTAVLKASPTEFADLWLLENDGSRRLTNINPQTAAWKLPTLSVVTWKGTNGDPVQGILELPPDYKKGQKVPLVVDIHGGPTTAWYAERMYHWFSGRTLLPGKGYAVLCPNYRGSSGYGDKFLIDLIGHENDWEVQDILKGVDHLVKEGIADPDRLAVMGWSNGGYLTNCCITHTDRFKAAISGAGIIDAVMEFGINDEPAYSMVFKRGLPWTPGNVYKEASPSWKLDRAKTPTLIHVGGNDDRCPPGHSRMLYRVLKEYNQVPTELLVYPGAAHGLRKYEHIRAKLEWDVAWLERYVMGKGK
jgi:dipeptidyl aminopeptidase/acylaminoacyl peptidase